MMLREMTEAELGTTLRSAAGWLKNVFPKGTKFVLIAFEQNEAYPLLVGMKRSQAVLLLRQMADDLESKAVGQ